MISNRVSWLGRLTIVVSALVLSVALVACGGDDDDDADADNTAVPEATEAAGAPATEETEPTEAPEEPTSALEPTEAAEPTSEPAGDVSISIAEGELGSYLTGPDGLTLYIFLRDAPDTSNCSGGCLETWPPLLAGEGAAIEGPADASGTFDSIETPSGMQVTYQGAPLYYFASDQAPGDTMGHLVGDVWFVARPETASTSTVGVREGDAGSYLVGPTGMSLYLFANDTEGTSNCTGGCLENWPALTVPDDLDPTAVDAAGGTLATITRDDGAIQVTYNGLPLYYFANDSVPGDTNGDGVGDVWSLATP